MTAKATNKANGVVWVATAPEMGVLIVSTVVPGVASGGAAASDPK